MYLRFHIIFPYRQQYGCHNNEYKVRLLLRPRFRSLLNIQTLENVACFLPPYEAQYTVNFSDSFFIILNKTRGYKISITFCKNCFIFQTLTGCPFHNFCSLTFITSPGCKTWNRRLCWEGLIYMQERGGRAAQALFATFSALLYFLY